MEGTIPTNRHIYCRTRHTALWFDIASEEEMYRVFLNIISLGSKDNTYKFAMARFLIDYSREHKITETHVEFPVIAEYFLRYYWPQICKLKIKHAPQRNKKPEIVNIIEKEFKRPYYPQTYGKIKEKERDKIQRCIDRIAKGCFHNVTWRFQKIKAGRAAESRIFFDYKIARDKHANKKYVDLDYGINLNADAIKFFKRYDAVLSKSVILEWSKFLERLNVGLPKLILKTEGGEPRRGGLAKFRKTLEPICGRCFYCRVPLDGAGDKHVEHVIPFDYILEDNIWNLVLACKQCNCKKLGGLPPSKYVAKLVERNRKYGTEIPELQRSLDRLDEKFKVIICRHYENAKMQGYMVLNDDFYKGFS